jgi:DUF4097 and DUF4098 domain-containing protein YvlB
LAVACLYTYKLEVPETHTYAAAGTTRLDAKTRNGAISVTASPDTVIIDSVLKYAYGRDKADAEEAIENVVYSDTIVGDELRVKAELPSGSRPYGASFTIIVPDSTALSLATTNGDVGVTNTVGDINAGTTNGNVELTGTTGTTSVSTTNGRIDVKVHSGAFYGATTNGAIDCDLAALGPTEDVGLATTNGKVTLLLPDDVSAVIEATNTDGLITIYDFTVTYETQDEHHIRARIGSGASGITIVTTSGDIVVRSRS